MILLVSVSGGRTSGYLAWWVKHNLHTLSQSLGGHEIQPVYVFANTGMEHNDTLRFLNDLDTNFGLGLVWLEGVCHPGERKATTYRLTSYTKAYRNDQWGDPNHPFHAFIAKYGIPNVKFKSCTREMKLNTITAYMRDNYPRDYVTALGIRCDEKRRVSSSATSNRIIYPLVDLEPTDKEDVLSWWKQYSWDLQIPEWQGNCVTCFKKSFKKLKKVWEESPEVFQFNDAMETQYPRLGPEFEKYPDALPRTFFRMNHSTKSLLRVFQEMPDVSSYIRDTDAGCSESCELYETE